MGKANQIFFLSQRCSHLREKRRCASGPPPPSVLVRCCRCCPAASPARTPCPVRTHGPLSAVVDSPSAPQPSGLNHSANKCAPANLSWFQFFLECCSTRRPDHAFGTSSSSLEPCVCPLDEDPRQKRALLAVLLPWQPPGPLCAHHDCSCPGTPVTPLGFRNLARRRLDRHSSRQSRSRPPFPVVAAPVSSTD